MTAVLESKKMVGYLVGYPISFVTSISTYQSSKEEISLEVSNQTASSNATIGSEVVDLLNDQARLLSVQIRPACILDPNCFTLNGKS